MRVFIERERLGCRVLSKRVEEEIHEKFKMFRFDL